MNVLAGLSGTNLPGKAIKQFLKRKECGTPVTSEQLELLKFPDQTAGASDSHAKTFQWPGNSEESQMAFSYLFCFCTIISCSHKTFFD